MARVPVNYTVRVLYRLGDPLQSSVPEYQNNVQETAESFLQRAGDQHGVMIYFGMKGNGRYAPDVSNRSLLWIQTEDGAYTDVTNCMMLAGMPGVSETAASAALSPPVAVRSK